MNSKDIINIPTNILLSQETVKWLLNTYWIIFTLLIKKKTEKKIYVVVI